MATATEKPIKTATYVYLPISVNNRAKIGLEDGNQALTGKITEISQVFMYEGWLYATFTTINSTYQSVPIYISQNKLGNLGGNEMLASESVITDKYGTCYSMGKIMGITEDGIIIKEESGEYMISRFL